MVKLIVKLEILHAIAKQLHYGENGRAFYAIHKLMDRVQKPLLGHVDSIKENYFLMRNIPVPTAKSLYTEIAAGLVDKYDLSGLQKELEVTIYLIEEIGHSNDLFQGDTDLLGKISSDLQNSLGLVNRTLAIELSD